MENINKDLIIQNEIVLGKIKIIIEPLCKKSSRDWGFMKVWCEHYNLPPNEWVYKLAKIKYLGKLKWTPNWTHFKKVLKTGIVKGSCFLVLLSYRKQSIPLPVECNALKMWYYYCTKSPF